VPGDIGRRYAEVSGDRNPIHLHPLTARLFGFPRAIAHGMWTKAHALAAFEGRLPSAFTVDVRFKQPVLLPAKAAFTSWATPEGWAFELWSGSKPHLEGAISSL
jgi:acyl dehydratase